MQYVALILDIFNDGDEDARIALPKKNSLDIGNRISVNETLHFAIVVGQHHHGDIQPGKLHLARQLSGGHVTYRQVRDNQIKARLRARQFQSLGAARHMRDTGNLLQVQFERFVDQQFIKPAIFAQDERIVKAGNQKNVLDLERHQVVEAFEARFSVEEGLGDGAGGHGGVILVFKNPAESE